MADAMVLEVQQWLNATYGNVSGFEAAPENGLTGWPTIYSLRMGLQHEIGITTLGEGFGDATKAALKPYVGLFKEKYDNAKITRLIKGAFWCKGISPGDFTDDYTAELTAAFEELQTDAGVTANGVVTVNLMAALFDMSAFVLVSNGKAKVRAMQQWLNSEYSGYTGILPCDGIYQRDTNVALIYALQLALNVANANGNFGSGTETALKGVSLSTGSTGVIVRIVEYGLYLNGFYDGDIGMTYTEEVGEAVDLFCLFMNYDNASPVAGYTAIKGLLTSNGDTSRNSDTFDTATQLLDASVIKKLYTDGGFSIVGRYLTGTVGTDYVDKSLSKAEIKLLTDAGFSIFPIYEDGGYVEDYFTAAQGKSDAKAAATAARKLGFPSSNVIYFACDVDLTGDDIPNTIIPYIKAVKSTLNSRGYETGLYGTRNVCLQAEADAGISYFFVADMSYGWSGNLGFAMPNNWAFDQFTEYNYYVDLDQDASSGRDTGVSEFNTAEISSSDDAVQALWPGFDHTVEVPFTLLDLNWLKITAKLTSEYEAPNDSTVITIKNGKVDEVSMKGFLEKLGVSSDAVDNLVISEFNKLSLTSEIEEGNVTVKSSTSSDGSYTFEIAWTVYEASTGVLEETITFALELELNLPDWTNWIDFSGKLARYAIIAAFLAGIVVCGAFVVASLPVDIPAAATAAATAALTALATALA
ncbi:glycoside hydrolase domain-containing protein [Lacticaseibacillus sp. N501-2]|uniref:glycoside hydrolase domain-containing protein n=1 Tax=Lacticaseibacillus salsurae TaxID=3367729 RepID=UPI0038B34034